MNERIRELAEQAGMTDDKFGMFFAKDKHNEDGVDLEKFAELIIKECHMLAVGNANWLPKDVSPAKGMADVFKKYFGVEE